MTYPFLFLSSHLSLLVHSISLRSLQRFISYLKYVKSTTWEALVLIGSNVTLVHTRVGVFVFLNSGGGKRQRLADPTRFGFCLVEKIRRKHTGNWILQTLIQNRQTSHQQIYWLNMHGDYIKLAIPHSVGKYHNKELNT